MLKGALSLLIRQLLLVACGALVTAGVIAEAASGYYCFSPKQVADFGATAVMLLIAALAIGCAVAAVVCLLVMHESKTGPGG